MESRPALAVFVRRWPVWVEGSVVALGLFPIYVLCANYSGQQVPDNVSVFLSGWALAQHGTLDVGMYPDFKPWTVLVDGGIYSDRPPGLIAWVAPFYLALGVASFPTIFPAGVAAAAATAAAVGLIHAVFRRLASARQSMLGTLIVAFGTATWTISADAVWPHGPGQMCLAVMMLALSSRRNGFAGIAGAAALLVRPISAIATATSGVYLSAVARAWKPSLRIGLGSLVGALGLVVYNRLVFDDWTLAPGSYQEFLSQWAGKRDAYDPTRPMTLAENLAGTLVSPTRGVLVLSPFLLALLPGMRSAWKDAPDWVRACALGGCGYALAQIYGNRYSGGSGFYSYRYTIESLTLLAPLLMLCWGNWTSRLLWRRRLFAVLAIFSVFQHAAGALYVTPSVELPYDSWRHLLLVEALQSAGKSEWIFVGLVSACAVLVSVTGARGERGQVEAPDDFH